MITASTILYILLALLGVSYVFGQTLDWLNSNHSKKKLPKEAKGIYDDEKYEKSQQYQRALNKFSHLSTTINVLISGLFLYFGGFGWLDSIVEPLVNHEVVQSLLYFGVLFIASDIISTPFQVYSTFVIEEKYGFNKTTVKLFIVDKLKGYLLTIILGGVVVGGLLMLIISIGEGFWIYFWVAISIFILIMNMFYSTLILPLFNKLTPLEAGELRDAVESYSKKVNFPLTNIFVIDGSKRSNKANAFFSGIGKKKKVVLYDTLIEQHTTEELVAIFAHEVGHYKKKHIIQGFVMSILQMGITLYIMSLMIFNESLSEALGSNQMRVHLNLIAFMMLYSPISSVTGLFMNMLSRKNEFEADRFAVETTNPNDLQSALKKLSTDNLSNLLPHPWYVFIHYSHPPLLKRLAAMQAVGEK